MYVLYVDTASRSADIAVSGAEPSGVLVAADGMTKEDAVKFKDIFNGILKR